MHRSSETAVPWEGKCLMETQPSLFAFKQHLNECKFEEFTLTLLFHSDSSVALALKHHDLH